jgi:hypothetical protein
MSDSENIEEVIKYIKPSNIILSDVSFELKEYCNSNGLPILDNLKKDHLDSLHSYLKKNFNKKKKIKIYNDINDIIDDKDD